MGEQWNTEPNPPDLARMRSVAKSRLILRPFPEEADDARSMLALLDYTEALVAENVLLAGGDPREEVEAEGCVFCRVCGQAISFSGYVARQRERAIGYYCSGRCRDIGLCKAKDERIEALVSALEDALEGMEDMVCYVSPYFQEKWGHQGYIDRAKEVLEGVRV